MSDEAAPETPEVKTVAPARPTPSRKTLTLLVAPIIVLFIVGTAANMFHPTLLVNAPLLLVALEPRFRYMLLVAPRVELLPFMVLVLVRRLFADPFLFALGRLYGDAGVRWMERQLQDTIGWVRKVERGFGKAAWVFVLLWPGLLVCTLAGATGMRFSVFIILNIVGTIATTYLSYAASDLVSGPINWINNLYSGNQKLFLIISIVSFGLMFVTRRLQGKGEPLSVKEVEKVLNEEVGKASDPDDDGKKGRGGGIASAT